MNDTVDNQGADILGFINGRGIIKRSWRVLSELIKSMKHFMKNVCGNLKGNFISTSCFETCKKYLQSYVSVYVIWKKMWPAFWHKYNPLWNLMGYLFLIFYPGYFLRGWRAVVLSTPGKDNYTCLVWEWIYFEI